MSCTSTYRLGSPKFEIWKENPHWEPWHQHYSQHFPARMKLADLTVQPSCSFEWCFSSWAVRSTQWQKRVNGIGYLWWTKIFSIYLLAFLIACVVSMLFLKWTLKLRCLPLSTTTRRLLDSFGSIWCNLLITFLDTEHELSKRIVWTFLYEKSFGLKLKKSPEKSFGFKNRFSTMKIQEEKYGANQTYWFHILNMKVLVPWSKLN